LGTRIKPYHDVKTRFTRTRISTARTTETTQKTKTMATIKKVLSTGVTTTQPANGGEIKAKLSDYDTYFDQPTLETELSNNTALLLNDVFKHFQI